MSWVDLPNRYSSLVDLRVYELEEEIKRLRQALMQNAQVTPRPVQQMPFGDGVAKAADHVLIMELLSRGYAVAKMPAEELAEELSK